MKIKLAILCPIRRKIAPGGEGTLENRIYDLAQALAGQGVDVTLFAAGGSQSPGGLVPICGKALEDDPDPSPAMVEAVALAEAFSRIREYDLVHSFSGLSAFPFAKLLGVPMVAAAPEHPLGERFAKTVHFIPLAEEGTATEFIKVYKAILAARENHRPWGHYENLAEGPDHNIKRITVAPGARLSYQKHQRRAERWVVISGEAVVTLEGEDIRLSPGDTIFIPKGAAHRMNNPGSAPLIFGEVQLGDYFGEDDIIRLQDDYGRSG
ncbi:MAG: cupin domain-containing protein [Nitrospinota bacterium]|nr:cupin domain-containing protein [Nitrospinota bacterium]